MTTEQANRMRILAEAASSAFITSNNSDDDKLADVMGREGLLEIQECAGFKIYVATEEGEKELEALINGS